MGKNKICLHLKNEKDKTYNRYFTGNGKEYYLICPKCQRNIKKLQEALIEVRIEEFEAVEEDILACEGIIGKASVLERKTNLYFSHKEINISCMFF